MDNTKSNNLTCAKSKRREVYKAEQLGLPEIIQIGRYNYEKAYGMLGGHEHAGAFEFCYLAKGQQSYQVGGREYRLKGGDIFLTFPDETHSSGHYPEEKGHLYWLVCKVPVKNAVWLGLASEASKKLLQALFSIKQRHFRGTVDMRELLDNIFETAAEPQSDLTRLTLANRVAAFLIRVAEEGARVNTATHQPFKPVLDYIDSHITERLAVPGLAEKAGLSVSRFKVLFKKLMGLPPADFVLRRKIERATYLLGQGKSNVTATAYDLGFSSSQYFATVFKRYTGKTPLSFVKKESP